MAAGIFDKLQLIFLSGLYILGGITFIIGVGILIYDILGKNLNNIVTETNRLAQKGLTEELSGLVGNASTLLNTINDMVRTRNGIAISLIIVGLLMMILPYYLSLHY
jgi:hypothetical protein